MGIDQGQGRHFESVERTAGAPKGGLGGGYGWVRGKFGSPCIGNNTRVRGSEGSRR